MNPEPEHFLPLTPAVFGILLALADGEKHGYAIMREIEAGNGLRMRMGPGTLYGSLDRMLKAGLIAESEGPSVALSGGGADAVAGAGTPNEVGAPHEGRRRYYRLSELGGKVLGLEAARMSEAVRRMEAKRILNPPLASQS